MKIDISDFYLQKGYKSVYINKNREQRMMAYLVKNDGSKTTISYAKYLYTSYYKCDVDKDCQVDHINGDKTDDRIENLQIITRQYNIKKDHKIKEMVLLQCPICGKEFLFEKRNLKSHPNPCCSRQCGGKKSHLHKN